jgi:predicted transcriptional regulator
MHEKSRGEREKRARLLLLFSRGAKSRRSILETLCIKPKNCNQIARETGLGWWTVQKHLQRMMSEKLVKSVDFGQIKFYDMTSEGEEALRLSLEQQENSMETGKVV